MGKQRGGTAVPKSDDGDPSRDRVPPEGRVVGEDPERLAADLQHLRDLLEADRVTEARRFVQELAQRWPEAERVQHYARVLEPPKVRMRPDIPARSREREWKWLEEHGREYPGCWLAIYGDQLIAADPDRRTVMAKAEQTLGEETYLIFHQPGSPQVE